VPLYRIGKAFFEGGAVFGIDSLGELLLRWGLGISAEHAQTGLATLLGLELAADDAARSYGHSNAMTAVVAHG
jgi:hypothetical protein